MANVNFKMNNELKSDLESVCERLGLSVSTVLNLCAREIVKEQGIPFKISCRPTTETEAQMYNIALSRLLDNNDKYVDGKAALEKMSRIYE